MIYPIEIRTAGSWWTRFEIQGGTNNNPQFTFDFANGGFLPASIIFNQYTPLFHDIIRTLTLLDGNGNTSIPGNLNVGGIDINTVITNAVNTAVSTAMNNCFPVGTFMMFAGAAGWNNGGMDT